MSEMPLDEGGMWRLRAFYRLIEKYVSISFSVSVNKSELNTAISDLYIPNASVDFGQLQNVYVFLYRIVMDSLMEIYLNAEGILPQHDSIDFIFDEQTEKKWIIEGWESFIQSRDERVRVIFRNTPRFESDKSFLPLQAADLWAWWVRRWLEEDVDFDRKVQESDFGAFKAERRIVKFHAWHDLPSLRETFVKWAKEEITKDPFSYNVTYVQKQFD